MVNVGKKNHPRESDVRCKQCRFAEEQQEELRLSSTNQLSAQVRVRRERLEETSKHVDVVEPRLNTVFL